MTCSASRPDGPGRLELRLTGDGSPSLWSDAFGEAFHCSRGALAEARAKFVAPAELERFVAGSTLMVVDVCVGLGYNSAALLEAAADRGLQVQWWGLELDPRPLALALADPGFRGLWRPATLAVLEQLRDRGTWRSASGSGTWWLGDARQQLDALRNEARGRCHLVLHDAFSPGHCPQLWSTEFLAGLGALLRPDGRLLTYCTAAAVRRGLQLAGLELASLAAPAGASSPQWSQGTAASPQPLVGQGIPRGDQANGILQALAPMELEHLQTRAAEPYRDPTGEGSTAAILAERQRSQANSGAGSTSAWRRRWRLAA